MEPKIISQKQPTKFTDDELKMIESIKDRFTENVISLGRLFLRRKELDLVEKSLISENESLKVEEKKLLDDIVKKYGEGTFDPSTGIFTPKNV